MKWTVHDPEVMGSNPVWVKFRMSNPTSNSLVKPRLQCPLTKNMFLVSDELVYVMPFPPNFA